MEGLNQLAAKGFSAGFLFFCLSLLSLKFGLAEGQTIVDLLLESIHRTGIDRILCCLISNGVNDKHLSISELGLRREAANGNQPTLIPEHGLSAPSGMKLYVLNL